ncbi:hypothetical protein [Glycomyces buryatensis]|uniref:SMI1/KNR4 family protein n=1 Tax=Glycomyces buryatensis TaxID=2570927 RepID=A0A4S8QKC1_9ACTN|nr:hypothetical protein [Glycomyces buryatensis]THV41879.1 hypothetical protein FAB82_09160 [Glycomyces buryatensis]
MQQNLVELAALLSMSPVDAPAIDWTEVTRELGSELPADYRALIDMFGPGLIRGSDIIIYGPGCPNVYYDLVPESKQRIEDLEGLWSDVPPEDRPPHLFVPGTHLVNWATSGCGEYFYWIADATKPPETWTVSLEQGRDGAWEHFDLGCVDFLLAAFTGRIDTFYLRSLPERTYTYEPLKELPGP